MPRLDRTGTYNARPYGWALQKGHADSRLLLQLSFLILEWQDVLNGAWIDVRTCAYDTTGKLWIFGKDGQRIDRNIETLVKVLNWSGDLKQFRIPCGEPGAWAPPDVQIKVEQNDWLNPKTQRVQSFIEVKWINPLGYAGEGERISDQQFAVAEEQAKQSDLAAVVDAIQKGKPIPKPKQTYGAIPTAGTFPMPTGVPGVPAVPPSMLPPRQPAPISQDYAPWNPPTPPGGPTAPSPMINGPLVPPPPAPLAAPPVPPLEPGMVPFTGQF